MPFRAGERSWEAQMPRRHTRRESGSEWRDAWRLQRFGGRSEGPDQCVVVPRRPLGASPCKVLTPRLPVRSDTGHAMSSPSPEGRGGEGGGTKGGTGGEDQRGTGGEDQRGNRG